MRTKLFLVIVCSLCVANMHAQSDYSNYLDDSMKELGTGNCEGAQKLYNVYKELSGQSKPSVQTLIDDCLAKKQKKEGKKSKIDLMDNSYCKANKNRYIAWNIAGAGYPWNLVTGIEFRAGGIVGVGLYGDIGMDFTTISYDYYDGGKVAGNTVKTAFRYAGGIRFYPYRGLFVDCGYGSIAKTNVSLKGMKNGQYKFYSTPEAARAAVQNSHGLLFHAGYNLVTNLSDGAGFFLGISGGASYDVINYVFAPSVNLKIGVAWGWHK